MGYIKSVPTEQFAWSGANFFLELGPQYCIFNLNILTFSMGGSVMQIIIVLKMCSTQTYSLI